MRASEQSAYPIGWGWPGGDRTVPSGVGGGRPVLPENGEDHGRALPEREEVRRLLGKFL